MADAERDGAGLPERRPDDGIGREDLQRVIRRAAELYAAETESAERLAPEEVLRIAEELGLPARHVRQALYELPSHGEEPSFLDRRWGPPRLTTTRAVPGEAGDLLRRLETYLVTREYLQLRRRRGDRLVLVPAADAMSKVARAFRRPKSRHYLAHGRSLVIAAQPLDQRTSHVRVDLDASDLRSEYAVAASMLGGGLGLAVASGLFFAVGIPVADFFGSAAGIVAGAAAGLGGLGATVATSLRVAGGKFRQRLSDARSEVEGLLDRVERGEPLDPPPSPVRRWLMEGPPGGRRPGG